MSAIFGVVGRVSPAELEVMGARLAHRGAVASCEEVAPGVHLGTAAETARGVVYRAGLAAVLDVAPLAGQADAEALLDGLADGGASALEGAGFPFALAAWDERSGTLRLARDFVGQKPLFWCALPGGGVAFATEYKSLLALEALPVEVDLDAVQYLQCYKRTPPGGTLLAGIRYAPPGAVISLDARGALLARDDMSPLCVDVRPASEAEVCEELARRYLATARRFVDGQSRIGVAVSGGIDSLSIAFAARQGAPDAELVGFTAGHGPDDPEIATAARAMQKLGGQHVPVVVTAEGLHESLPLAIWHFEHPVGRTETMQMFEMGRAARAAGFDWLLSGMGSDSLFAGMPKHKVLWLSHVLPPLRRDLQEFYGLTQSGRKPERLLARCMDAVYFRGKVPPVARVQGASWTPEPVKLPPPGPEFLNHALVTNVNETISRSLVRLERPLAAFGIAFATPFFDRAFMEYAFTLPSRLKIRRGREKYILRAALRTIVSADLLNVPKGISRIPPDRAFASTLLELSRRYLHAADAARRGWFVPDEIRAIERSLARRHYHVEAAMRLWTAIVTEIWAEIYLDRRGERPAPETRVSRSRTERVIPRGVGSESGRVPDSRR
ncbi:MAG TPA: asparagine synthase-related protein [Woeseiaceae bacterium]